MRRFGNFDGSDKEEIMEVRSSEARRDLDRMWEENELQVSKLSQTRTCRVEDD